MASPQDWEDLCLDPYQSSREEGEKRGREAGLEAGFSDGRELGEVTAIDYALDLGFIRGVCTACTRNKQGLDERVQKTLRDLIRAIDDFPGPSHIFREQQQQQHDHDHNHDHNHPAEEPAEAVVPLDDNDSSSADVLHKMQRIRARFKLLTVQLGIPHFSLKQVMDEVASSSHTLVAPDTSDW